MLKTCKCGMQYEDAGYKKICAACFSKNKKQEQEYLKQTIYELENRKQNIDKETLKQIIYLCHPDKHNNSELSNKIFCFLRGMK